ncbi:hypothetical protein NKH77_44735 [Streptomyces sp. M19]
MHHLTVDTARTPVTLRSDGTGPDGLRFAATDRRPPGPTEVEVEVSTWASTSRTC